MAEPAIVYETARALAESATLAEAAPRMLGRRLRMRWAGSTARSGRSIAAADTLRCVGTWHASSLAGRRVRRQPAARRRSRAGSACRDASGSRPSRPGFPTSSPTPNFPARGVGRARRPARRVRASDPARRRRAGRDGVLQPRHPPARRGAARAMMTAGAARSGCSSSGSGPATSSTASSRCRSTCSASRPSTATSSG